MLFANIAALVAKGVTVQFTVNSAPEGKLEVNLIPTAEGGTTLNLVPKSFVGTPAELDAEFAEVIAGYATVNLTLKQQLEDVATVASAAAKEASEAAVKKSATKPAGRNTGNTKGVGGKSPTLIEGDDSQQEEEQEEGSTGGDNTSSGAPAASIPGAQSQTLPLEL